MPSARMAHDPSLGLINLLQWLQKRGKSLLTRLPVYHKKIKLKNSKMEEMHRARSRRVLSSEASVLMKLGCPALPLNWELLTWELPEPYPIAIFTEPSSYRCNQLTPFPAPLASLEYYAQLWEKRVSKTLKSKKRSSHSKWWRITVLASW